MAWPHITSTAESTMHRTWGWILVWTSKQQRTPSGWHAWAVYSTPAPVRGQVRAKISPCRAGETYPPRLLLRCGRRYQTNKQTNKQKQKNKLIPKAPQIKIWSLIQMHSSMSHPSIERVLTDVLVCTPRPVIPIWSIWFLIPGIRWIFKGRNLISLTYDPESSFAKTKT